MKIKKFSDISIKSRVMLAVLTVLALVLLLAGISWWQTASLWQKTQSIYNQPVLVNDELSQLLSDFAVIDMYMDGSMAATSRNIRNIYLQKAASVRIDIDTSMKMLTNHYDGPKEDILGIKITYSQWTTMLDSVVSGIQKGTSNHDNSVAFYNKVEGEYIINLSNAVNNVQLYENHKAENIYNETKDHVQFLDNQLLFVTGIIILFLLLVNYLLSRSIIRPLKSLTRTTLAFDAGDLDRRNRYVSENELGILSSSFNQMAQTIQSKIIYEKNENKRLEDAVNNRTQDLTKEIELRKQVEKDLRESEAKFRTLFELAPDPIYLIDREGNLLDGNRAIEKFTGYSIDELVKKNIFTETFITRDQWKAIKERETKLAYEEPGPIEVRLIKKDGSQGWVEISSTLIDLSGRSQILGIARDITQQKETEKQLKESREKYRLISGLTSDYIFEEKAIGNGSFEMMWIAGSFEKITGYTIEEFMKIGGWRKILHPEDSTIDDQALSLLQKNQQASITVRVFHKNGKIVWIKSFIFPIWDDKGDSLAGILGSAKDITEEKTLQLLKEIQFNITKNVLITENLSELFASIHKELMKAMDAQNFKVVEWDQKNNLFNVKYSTDNRSLISKYKADKTLSFRIMKQKKSLLLRKKELLDEFKKGMTPPEGISIPEVWMGVPLYLNGMPYGVMVFKNYQNAEAYDQYSLQLVEAIANELSIYLSKKMAQDENLKLSKVIEQSPVNIIITDTNANIEFVNPAFTKVTGYTIDEVIGQNPKILSTHEKTKDEYKALWDTIKSGNIWRGEFQDKKKNGELYWEQSSISPITNEKGEITHFVAIKEDITERKQMLDDLIKAKEKAEESDRLKMAFLANMSHEIRTPMNGILGFTTLLGEPKITAEEQAEFIRNIEKSGARMLSTVNDIITISKIESDQMSVSISDTNVYDLIESIYDFYKTEAEHKGLQFLLKNGLFGKESIIKTDQKKVYDIVDNLIKNSIKFTQSGSIELGYVKKDHSLEFFVKDTGIGIKSNRQEIIFERFRQGSELLSRGYEGSGLGLAISKAYVEMLGGKIWVQSQEGKGSVFYFTIPYKQGTKENDEIKVIDSN